MIMLFIFIIITVGGVIFHALFLYLLFKISERGMNSQMKQILKQAHIECEKNRQLCEEALKVAGVQFTAQDVHQITK